MRQFTYLFSLLKIFGEILRIKLYSNSGDKLLLKMTYATDTDGNGYIRPYK